MISGPTNLDPPPNLKFIEIKSANEMYQKIRKISKIDSKNKVFGSDYNQISIVTKNQIKKFKKMTKVNCAKQIIKQIYNTI